MSKCDDATFEAKPIGFQVAARDRGRKKGYGQIITNRARTFVRRSNTVVG